MRLRDTPKHRQLKPLLHWRRRHSANGMKENAFSAKKSLLQRMNLRRIDRTPIDVFNIDLWIQEALYTELWEQEK